MAQEQAKQLLQQGIAAARAQQHDQARDLLRQAIRMDPQNETAWLWLSSVAADDKERLFCLKQLLSINPKNEHAIKGLQALGVQAGEEAKPTGPSTTVPQLDDEKYARVQQTAEAFMRRYNPQPVDHLGIEWTSKRRRRYGEKGATRLRQMAYAGAALAVIVVAVLAYVVVSGITQGDEGTEVAGVQTATFPPTATMTATAGGPTPTPFENLIVQATPTAPAALPQGNQYPTPTEIYPRPIVGDISGRADLDTAIDLYSIGDYDDALALLEAIDDQSKDCFPSVTFYQAMILIEQGNYSQANNLLNKARTTQVPYPASSCHNKELVWAVSGYLSYLRDDFDQAIAFSEKALEGDSEQVKNQNPDAAVEGDPDVVLAWLTLAQAQFERGQIDAAIDTADRALQRHPADVRLLLIRAEIELAQAEAQPTIARYQSALRYIGQALYVNPTLQPALRYQAEIYLALARLPGSRPQQLQYYGLAVRSAQTLLLYYPGDPLGHWYLARARRGEGNDDLALQTLNRLLAAEDSLPGDEPEVQQAIGQAYLLRGELHYEHGRLQQAYTDLSAYGLQHTGDRATWEKLTQITLTLANHYDALSAADRLLDIEPSNKTYRLWKARAQAHIAAETCDPGATQFACEEYDALLAILRDNTFLTDLSGDRLAEAYSYRAQARYWDTLRDLRTAGDEPDYAILQTAYSQALADMNQALSMRDTALDHYYRGLILDQLGQLAQAQALDGPLAGDAPAATPVGDADDAPLPVGDGGETYFARAAVDYEWLVYWDTFYAYPFANYVYQRLETLKPEALVTPTPTATAIPERTATPATPEPETPPPDVTRTPQRTGTAATPAATLSVVTPSTVTPTVETPAAVTPTTGATPSVTPTLAGTTSPSAPPLP
jgi:tetratricopeptide (TPR) repeat protein